MRRILQSTATAFVSLALVLAGSTACDPTGGGEPPEYGDFEDDGPSNITTFTLSSCRYAVPSPQVGQYPVITWGNGTGGSPSTYTGFLNHWASHEFITTASTSSSTGTGSQMRQCLQNAINLGGGSGTLGGHVHPSLYGASGHSQGGGGTLNAAEDDSRIDATVLVQPDIVFTSNGDANSQTADMLYLGGSSDSLAPPSTNGNAIYSQSDVPTFWAVRSGASHFEPTGSGTNDYTGISTAWFVYKLKPDAANNADAASLFQGSNCGICGWSVWEVRQKNNP